ncbi:BQ2448_3794 [Microbotryum intermedium]|uniref:BQ2448_3794 protein n=1 Tax=Microbotryum intermedium TaxID=269621 RepID=A0A238FB06_9BASI|nr:BQ2448_3794 [Microbotryum intermedium]
MVIVLPKQITSTKWLVANGRGTPCQACIARKSQCDAARPRCGACVLISQSRGLLIAQTPSCTYVEPSQDSAEGAQDDPTSIADQLFDQHAAERKAKRQKRVQELEERLRERTGRLIQIWSFAELMEEKLKARRSSSKKDAIPVSDYTPLAPPSAEEQDALLRSLVPRKIPSPPPRHLRPTLEPLFTRQLEEVPPEVSWKAAHLGLEKNLAISSPCSSSNRSGSSSGRSEASSANERNRKHSTLMTAASSIWPQTQSVGGGPPHSPDSSQSNHAAGSPQHASNVASTSHHDRPLSSISSCYPTHHTAFEANLPVLYAPCHPTPTQTKGVDLRPNSAKSEPEHGPYTYPPTYQSYVQPQLAPPNGLHQTYRGDNSAQHVWDQRSTTTLSAYPSRPWSVGDPPSAAAGHVHHQQQTYYAAAQEHYPPLDATYAQQSHSRNQDGQNLSHIYQNSATNDSTGALGYGGAYMGR